MSVNVAEGIVGRLCSLFFAPASLCNLSRATVDEYHGLGFLALALRFPETKTDWKAVIETMHTATEASDCSQKSAQMGPEPL